MKKADDPKRIKLRAARDAAAIKAEILRRGIARVLEESYMSTVEDLAPVLDAVNGDLLNAVKAYECAIEAYRPYMSRRIVRGRRPLKKAA